MKLAIIGSRKLQVENIERYLPEGVTEIVSGGATGVDRCARRYATEHGILLTEFLPDYPHYGRSAPLLRDIRIVDYADEILAFWDGISRGTAFTIRQAQNRHKKVHLFLLNPPH